MWYFDIWPTARKFTLGLHIEYWDSQWEHRQGKEIRIYFLFWEINIAKYNEHEETT